MGISQPQPRLRRVPCPLRVAFEANAAAPFAALAVHFSSNDKAFLAFGLPAGPLLCMAGIRVFRDPDDAWTRLMRAMPRFPLEIRGTRAIAAAGFWVIGLAYMGAGCIGVAALL